MKTYIAPELTIQGSVVAATLAKVPPQKERNGLFQIV